MTRSTPDALWNAPSLRVLRPAAVICTDLRRGSDLDGCSLSIPAGARVLLVSDPDGAASTLVRVLAGLSRPERGRFRIAGLGEPGVDGWGRRLAYVGPAAGLHAWMTPTEVLRLAADVLDLGRAERDRRVERAAAWARIPNDAMARSLGRGGIAIEQRTALAAALVGDPEILLLDEPLRAIEAEERAQLLRIPGRRRTILLASRYPASEVGLAAWIVMLRHGQVALIASVRDLEAAGLPLSHRGIDALAAMHGADAGPGLAAPRTA